MSEKKKKVLTLIYIFFAALFMCLVAHDVVKGYCSVSYKIHGRTFTSNVMFVGDGGNQVITMDSFTGTFYSVGQTTVTINGTNVVKYTWNGSSWNTLPPNTSQVLTGFVYQNSTKQFSNAPWNEYYAVYSSFGSLSSNPWQESIEEFSTTVPYVDVNSIDNEDGTFVASAWVNDVRSYFEDGDKIYIDCYWRVPDRATADSIISTRNSITSGAWLSSLNPIQMSTLRTYFYRPIYDNTTLITVDLSTQGYSSGNQYLSLQINKEKFVYDIHNADVNQVYSIYQSADWSSDSDNVDLCVRLGYMYRLDIYVMRGNLQGPKTTLLFDTNGKKISGGNINKLVSEITVAEQEASTQALTQRAISDLQDAAQFRSRTDVDLTTTEITDSWEDIVEAVKGSSEVVLVIPLLMSYLFSWLPSGLGAIISFGVTSIVVISIYKALRG